jgi:hypothetical protein
MCIGSCSYTVTVTICQPGGGEELSTRTLGQLDVIRMAGDSLFRPFYNEAFVCERCTVPSLPLGTLVTRERRLWPMTRLPATRNARTARPPVCCTAAQ